MPTVKYRVVGPGLAPRNTQLPIPGWGGEVQPRADGSHEQVWHCAPFSEGARYGLELLYPFEEAFNYPHLTPWLEPIESPVILSVAPNQRSGGDERLGGGWRGFVAG